MSTASFLLYSPLLPSSFIYTFFLQMSTASFLLYSLPLSSFIVFIFYQQNGFHNPMNGEQHSSYAFILVICNYSTNQFNIKHNTTNDDDWVDTVSCNGVENNIIVFKLFCFSIYNNIVACRYVRYTVSMTSNNIYYMSKHVNATALEFRN